MRNPYNKGFGGRSEFQPTFKSLILFRYGNSRNDLIKTNTQIIDIAHRWQVQEPYIKISPAQRQATTLTDSTDLIKLNVLAATNNQKLKLLATKTATKLNQYNNIIN